MIALAVTAVKGTRLRSADEVFLDRDGAAGDRAFFIIDERGRMLNGKVHGELQSIVADYDPDGDRLALAFPDGAQAEDHVRLGAPVPVRFFSRPLQARPVEGPFADALSAFLGRPVRLVRGGAGVDRGRHGAASLISRGSLERLAEAAERSEVDPRRFRMLIEVDGIEPHAEDRWVGRHLRAGEATLRVNGHVGRCLITSMDPESGVVDLPTLDLLGEYRRELEFSPTEPLPFGVYAEVTRPGRVRVGDRVELG